MTIDQPHRASDPATTGEATPAIFRSLTPGLFLITLGSLLLTMQLELLDVEQLWKLWPIGLIMAGISELEQWWRNER